MNDDWSAASSAANSAADSTAPGTLAAVLGRLGMRSYLEVMALLREGILVIDPQLMILGMNPAAAEMLGRPPEELVGAHVCDFFGQTTCPSDTLAETLARGEAILDFQTAVRLHGGGSGQVLIRTVPLLARDGDPLGVALILGDVTELTALRKQISARYRLGNIIGRDRKMQELYQLIEDIAASEATVLIRGESGTGKELVARAIHNASDRAAGPFVSVNCSALSEHLLESELFGHVKGAFTGAIADRTGRFGEAAGGTIFLDEIGDVSPVVQVKLLRVLQERVVERVGDNRSLPVDVRVVSATNRDLEGLLATGRLREDFYYRIKVVSLVLPLLRDRREDIPLLVEHFLERMKGRRKRELRVSDEAMAVLMNYSWPGNVRELENALEHAAVLSRDGIIQPAQWPPELRGAAAPASLHQVERHSPHERELILAALDKTGWNRSRAARKLGIDRTTLWRKIKEYDLAPED